MKSTKSVESALRKDPFVQQCANDLRAGCSVLLAGSGQETDIDLLAWRLATDRRLYEQLLDDATPRVADDSAFYALTTARMWFEAFYQLDYAIRMRVGTAQRLEDGIRIGEPMPPR